MAHPDNNRFLSYRSYSDRCQGHADFGLPSILIKLLRDTSLGDSPLAPFACLAEKVALCVGLLH